MVANLPPDLITRLKSLILPFVNTVDDRDNLLTEAFYLADQRLYQQIKREGNPNGFCIHCIKSLIDFGCLNDGSHALTLLLNTIRSQYGVDKQHEIDQLVPVVNALCTTSDDKPESSLSPPPTLPSIPVQTLHTPVEQRTPTVFISYSHQNAEFAERLIMDLNAAGHACWLDKTKIKSGDEWVRSITEGINNSYAFISVVSPAANDSTWVRREFLWAEYKKKRIFPVMAEACDLVIYLMERQVVAMHQDYPKGLAELLQALPSATLPIISDPTDNETRAAEEILTIPEALPITRRRLELEYLDQLRAEVLFDLEKYTPLGGESQFVVEVRQGKSLALAFMRPEFEHWMEQDQAHMETRHFDNAVDEILKIKRAVLLGEPGGGKTTTLLSLAGKLAETAQNNPKAALPLFVRLGRWTDPDQSLFDFIASQLGALGTHLQSLIDEGRAVPLLDGMNEIPVSQREAKYQQVQTFIWRYPDWVAVASCRERDYTIDLKLDRITVTPLDSFRVREFVRRYLGAEAGEVLFWKIVGEDSRRFELRFQERFAEVLPNWQEVFWLHDTLTEGVEWEQEFINTRYYGWDRWRRLRDQPGGLMKLAHNPYMLAMLTQVYLARGDLPTNRGDLFREFVTTLLVRENIIQRDPVTRRPLMTEQAYDLQFALAELAYDMQIQRERAELGSALTVLPLEIVQKFLNERQIYIAANSSLLEVGAEGARFSHQLLQEYFAALALNGRVFGNVVPGSSYAVDKPLAATDIWKPTNWWEHTNWEEAVVLLAGLYSDDCTRVIEWVNQANPEVAALAISRSGAGLAEATKERLSAQWLARLTDLEHDPQPKARAAVGRALGITGWDTRKGVNTSLHEGVKLPDIAWVEVPDDGEWIYQDKKHAGLPTFQISRYLITYAQFQAFIDASDGFYNPQWWEGLAADKEHRSSAGDQAFKFWNHPRERVSWYDAVAFCRWLSSKLGYEVRLPIEQEWEKAARGTDGREYPYGGQFDAAKGNTLESDIGQTSAVGTFPDGASPYGVLDMSGNVFQWCLNKYDNRSATVVDDSGDTRVRRGGSWSFNKDYARAAYRYYSLPSYRFNEYGFRIVRPPSLNS